MQSFKSKKHHDRKWFVLYYGQYIAWILAAFCIIYFLFGRREAILYLPMPLVIFAIASVRRSRQLILNEVVIINNLAIFYVYNFWKGHFEKKTTIDKLKTELDNYYSEGLFSSSTTALFFFHHQPGTFYITPEKDHFSKEMIVDLNNSLNQIQSQNIKPVYSATA